MASKFHGIRNAALLSAASIALLTGSAFAQNADIEEVVVTGTLIRGVAPVGSNVVGISRSDIESSGLIDSNLILGTLPQSNFFMSLPEPASGVGAGIVRIPILTPQLRDMGNAATATGNTTLVMLNGSRIVPVGIEQSVVDAGVVPTGITERVESVLDGVSAVYGSDAVGGVINYIPRRRVDRTEAGVQYGFADAYYQISADVTSGKSWDTGGIGFSYTFGKNSNILDRDRPYGLPENWFEGRRSTGLVCEGYTHATTGTAPNQRRFVMTPAGIAGERTDWCDSVSALNSDFTTAQERHGGFLTFTQDITETIKFDLSALYSWRFRNSNFGPFGTTLTVRSTNPYFRSLTAFGVTNATTQSVGVDFGPVFGYDASHIANTTQLGQVSPMITASLGEWELRVAGSYGKSDQTTDRTQLNTALLTAYGAGTTLTTTYNPYDVTQSQNKALLGDLIFHDLRYGRHEMMQVRAVADGPLFALPGGEVRAAAGGEWTKTKFEKRLTDPTNHIWNDPVGTSASVKALFGEVIVPVVGPDNRMSFVESLTLSGSVRWDDYAQFGTTVNPKIAATYEPVDWITVRGNWGTSFRAPNVVDKLGAVGSTVRCIGAQPGCAAGVRTVPIDVLPFGLPAGPNVYINFDGTTPGVTPETSKNLSIGLDVRPPWIDGLTLSASYYKIDYTNQISIPLPNNSLDPVFRDLPEIVVMCVIPNTYPGSTPTSSPVSVIDPGCAARIDAFTAGVSNAADVLSFVRNAGYQIVYAVDSRNRNLGKVNTAGLDYSARYVHPTSWGSFNASLSGTCNFKQDTQVFPTSPLVPRSELTPMCRRFTMGAGVTYGDFSANATLLHQAGNLVAASANRVPDQTTIDQFDLVNLSFRWNVNGSHPLAQDLRLTLTINNVFDSSPPINRTTTGGTANGQTLGRLVQFGINKRF